VAYPTTLNTRITPAVGRIFEARFRGSLTIASDSVEFGNVRRDMGLLNPQQPRDPGGGGRGWPMPCPPARIAIGQSPGSLESSPPPNAGCRLCLPSTNDPCRSSSTARFLHRRETLEEGITTCVTSKVMEADTRWHAPQNCRSNRFDRGVG
jgi:hypothetical protein